MMNKDIIRRKWLDAWKQLYERKDEVVECPVCGIENLEVLDIYYPEKPEKVYERYLKCGCGAKFCGYHPGDDMDK